MISRVIFVAGALLISSPAVPDCSIWGIGDRLASSVSPATREAFSLLDDAATHPELMHNKTFRSRLASAMERAGYDGKRYLAPPTESGPFPSKHLISDWVSDFKKIATCN